MSKRSVTVSKRVFVDRSPPVGITKEEYRKSHEPYEAYVRLENLLRSFQNKAISMLREHGYVIPADYDVPSHDATKPDTASPRHRESRYTIFHLLPPFEEMEGEALEARIILGRIFDLRDKMRDEFSLYSIIEAAIFLGVESAHAYNFQFERLYAAGKKSAEGYKLRGKYLDKADFQALAIQHKERFTNLAELREINAFKPYFRIYGKGHTIRDWVSEILPGHLKVGRPANKK
jgi:hypothetical protein